MLWLLQTNFFREAGYARLVETLSRLSLPLLSDNYIAPSATTTSPHP